MRCLTAFSPHSSGHSFIIAFFVIFNLYNIISLSLIHI